MAARDADVPPYSYLIAVFAGLFGLPAGYALVDFVAAGLLGNFLTGSPVRNDGDVWVAATFFALGNSVLGAAFGLAWPEKRWRWGVWLCAVPICLVSFLADGMWDFVALVVTTLIPACLGAYAAAKFHLKFTAVDESG